MKVYVVMLNGDYCMKSIYSIANEDGCFWNGESFTKDYDCAEKFKSAPSAKKTLRALGKTTRIFLIENFGYYDEKSFEWRKTYLERK